MFTYIRREWRFLSVTLLGLAFVALMTASFGSL